MTAKPLISVVIPSFNDEPIIHPFYSAIKETLDAQDLYDYELIYVDDGRSDGSQDTLAELAKSDDRVAYVELFRNFGQQRALFAGLKESRGDYVVTIDGDFQTEPGVIIQLADALSRGFDLASGIRKRRQDRWFSVVSSKIGNMLINKILQANITDFGSVKGFSRQLVDEIIKREHYFSDVYPAAVAMHPSLVEIEVMDKQRPSGRAHWNLWMRFRLYLDLYVSYGDEHFSLPFRSGIFVLLLGFLMGTGGTAYKIFFGHQASFFQIGTLSFIVCFSGLSMTAWSLMMSFLVRVYKQNVFDEPFSVRRIIRKKYGH